jgi:hypothetical protein
VKLTQDNAVVLDNVCCLSKHKAPFEIELFWADWWPAGDSASDLLENLFVA